MTNEELINGLKHMADDHPCCRLAIAVTINRLTELEQKNADMRKRVDHALDALWKVYGNGFGTPMEDVIADLQTALDHST